MQFIKTSFQDYIGTDLLTNAYSEKGDIDVYCDAQYLPFKDNTFEMCFCVATLYQIQNTNLVLSEISRVLKLGGYFIAFDYNKKTTKRLRASYFCYVWSPWELRRTIQKAGFHAQIIDRWKYESNSSKGIKAVIRKLSYVPGFYFITSLFFEGWNIVVASKRKQKDKDKEEV